MIDFNNNVNNNNNNKKKQIKPLTTWHIINFAIRYMKN